MYTWLLWYSLSQHTVWRFDVRYWHILEFCQVFLPDKNESGDRTWDLLSVIVSFFFDTECLLPHELFAPPCTHSRPGLKNSKPSGAHTRASSATSSSFAKQLIQVADSSRPTSSGAKSALQVEKHSGDKFSLTNRAQEHQAQGSQEQGGHGQSQWMEHRTDLLSLPQRMPGNDSQPTDGLKADSFLFHMARCTLQLSRSRSASAAPPSHTSSPCSSYHLTHTSDKHPVDTSMMGDATDDVTDVSPASQSISSGLRCHEDLHHSCSHGTAAATREWSTSSRAREWVRLIHSTLCPGGASS